MRVWPRVPLLGPLVRAFPRGPLVVWLSFVAAPGEDWEFSRADFGPAGEYHLEAETVPEPTRDPALRDAAIHELAADEFGAEPAELIIGTKGEAARRLLDLSLADGRYAPAVVEAAVRSLIRAWRRFAIGGGDAYHALAALSSYEIAEYARSADLPARLQAIDVVALVPSPRPALFLRTVAIVQVDAYARPELRGARSRLSATTIEHLDRRPTPSEFVKGQQRKLLRDGHPTILRDPRGC